MYVCRAELNIPLCINDLCIYVTGCNALFVSFIMHQAEIIHILEFD